MLDEVVAERVVKQVGENFLDQVEWLGQLVAARSDQGTEAKMAAVVGEKLRQMGYKPEKVGVVKGRENLVCRLGLARARKSLMLHACMDVNGVDEKYQGEPYKLTNRGDKLWGGGIWNMKASIAAYVYAVQALARAGVLTSGKLVLALTADGISGLESRLGTKWILNHGYKTRAAILGSPGMSIGIGHRGGYRFKIVTKGEAVHTGSMLWQNREKGVSAIEAMAEVIRVLKKTEVAYKPAKAFPGKKPVFTFPTMINGGKAINMVPDKCEAYGEVRLMPGNSNTQVRMRIEEKLETVAGLRYELEDLLYIPAAEVDSKEEVVESALRAGRWVMGDGVKAEGIGPWNNGWLFCQKDIPAVMQVPLEGGVERWGIEWVSAASLRRLTAVIALTIADYFGD